MGKEAQKIATILNDCFPYIGKKDRRNEAIRRIEDIYSKLPEDKPLLLKRDNPVFRKINSKYFGEHICNSHLEELCQAQRDADIKHYEEIKENK